MIPKRFNIVCTISSSCEIRQVELNLIPPFVKSHGHCANEGFNSSGALVVRCSESSPDILVIQYLHFESEILLQLHSYEQFIHTFLMIITRKGSLMPRVLLASAGQVIKLVETLVPMISSTELWMSGSVSRLIWPFLTCLSQI